MDYDTAFTTLDSGMGTSLFSSYLGPANTGQFDFDFTVENELEVALNFSDQIAPTNPFLTDWDLESGSAMNFAPTPPPEEPSPSSSFSSEPDMAQLPRTNSDLSSVASPRKFVVNIRLKPQPFGPQRLLPAAGSPSKTGPVQGDCPEFFADVTDAPISSDQCLSSHTSFSTEGSCDIESLTSADVITSDFGQASPRTSGQSYDVGDPVARRLEFSSRGKMSPSRGFPIDSQEESLRMKQFLEELAVSSSDDSSSDDDDGMEEVSERSTGSPGTLSSISWDLIKFSSQSSSQSSKPPSDSRTLTLSSSSHQSVTTRTKPKGRPRVCKVGRRPFQPALSSSSSSMASSESMDEDFSPVTSRGTRKYKKQSKRISKECSEKVVTTYRSGQPIMKVVSLPTVPIGKMTSRPEVALPLRPVVIARKMDRAKPNTVIANGKEKSVVRPSRSATSGQTQEVSPGGRKVLPRRAKSGISLALEPPSPEIALPSPKKASNSKPPKIIVSPLDGIDPQHKSAVEAVRKLMAARCGVLVNGAAPPPVVVDLAALLWTSPDIEEEEIPEPRPKKLKSSSVTPTNVDQSLALLSTFFNRGLKKPDNLTPPGSVTSSVSACTSSSF